MANLVSGGGWAALNPKRLRLLAYREDQIAAYSANPAGTTPAEVIGSQGITATVQYGALGTCQSATLGVVDAPEGWHGRPGRLIVLELESEHGTQPVFAGFIGPDVRRQGRLSTIPLLGLHQLFADGPEWSKSARVNETTSTPLAYPPITRGTLAFGAGLTHYRNGDTMTRREAIMSILGNDPRADWGVNPRMDGVMGFASAASRYTVDRATLGNARLGDVDYLGYPETGYTTAWTFRPGEGMGELAGERGVSILTPLRLGRGEASPGTVIVTETVDQGSTVSGRSEFPAYGASRPFPTNAGLPTQYSVALPVRTTTSRPKQVRVSLSYRLDSMDTSNGGNTATFQAQFLAGPSALNNAPKQEVIMTAGSLGLVMTLMWTLDREVLEQINGASIQVTPLSMTAVSASATIVSITVASDNEKPTQNITPPDGFGLAPWQARPAERTLNGVWLIPPALDNEIGQDIAGATVTWNKDEATTKYATGTLPVRYKGAG